MEPRKIIDEKLTFGIKPSKEYKENPFCRWKELLKIKGLLPDDVIHEFTYAVTIQHEPEFGNIDYDEEYPKSYYTPSIIVIRPRPENDEEYSARMKDKVTIEMQKERHEKLEYLRLKAKFEK